MCWFVQETHKDNGENYPPSMLHQLLAAFQQILRMNKVPFNLFDKSDLCFGDLHNTLDSVCVKLRKDGVSAEVNHAPVIILEHENISYCTVCVILSVRYHPYCTVCIIHN